jgi:hypothetical protein
MRQGLGFCFEIKKPSQDKKIRADSIPMYFT